MVLKNRNFFCIKINEKLLSTVHLLQRIWKSLLQLVLLGSQPKRKELNQHILKCN